MALWWNAGRRMFQRRVLHGYRSVINVLVAFSDLTRYPWTESYFWSQPTMVGDIPPPCRAHASAVAGSCIIIFGGGHSTTYTNDLYILDTRELVSYLQVCSWY